MFVCRQGWSAVALWTAWTVGCAGGADVGIEKEPGDDQQSRHERREDDGVSTDREPRRHAGTLMLGADTLGRALSGRREM